MGVPYRINHGPPTIAALAAAASGEVVKAMPLEDSQSAERSTSLKASDRANADDQATTGQPPAVLVTARSELVYISVIAAVKVMLRALDVRVHLEGGQHIPREGGAVLACTHISYVDFIFCGFAAQPSGRFVRFMAKQNAFAHRVGGPLMRGMRHIPVDRDRGRPSYEAALSHLRSDAVVGLFPEANVGQSFTVRKIKSGAARLAAAAEVPLIPMAIWGPQRLWPKGRPRTVTRRHVPVTILVGAPMRPARSDDRHAVSNDLRANMSALLERAQREYPDKPAGAEEEWWQPAYLGGSAPSS